MKVTTGRIIQAVDSLYTEMSFTRNTKDVVFEFFNDDGVVSTLLTISTEAKPNAVGVHLTGGFDDLTDFEFRLNNAIESALNDCFPAIYIHDTTIHEGA